MPVVNYEQYCQMLDHAKHNKFAYPAINVTSSETVNAALLAFAEAKSDGIIQVSTGGGKFASGLGVASMTKGAIALAAYTHMMAEEYDINIALHTDHCHPEHVENFLKPLITETKKRRAKGLPNLFNSHMYDGSVLSMNENIAESKKLMEECVANDIILEIETGIVGGEEDVVETLGSGACLDLVFHGGSGSDLAQIHETLDYGVIKMNVDTDTQYAYTQPIVDHIMKNYDGVLKIESEVGNKKVYDPRSYGAKAERNMANRIMRACEDLRSMDTSLGVNI